MRTLVYQDYVHNNAVLFRRLCDHFGHDHVRFCDAGDIEAGALAHVDLFVMPGGADLYYCEKLNGVANKAIRAFVENGGTYLGICAGAYYGCTEIEWAKAEKDPICGARELAFTKGKAIGPVYDFIENGDINKSWDAAAEITFGDITCPVFYSGGPVFEDHDGEILARYNDLPDKPAAIIECSVSNGKAILCSPHLEYNAESVKKTRYRLGNASYERSCQIAQTLASNDTAIEKIWNTLMDRVKAAHNGKEKEQAA